MTAASPAIALDVHAHLIPVQPDRLAGMPGVAWHPSEERLELDGHAIGIKNLFQPAALIDWMDRNGVERAWVSPPPPAYRQELDEAQARAWIGYLNDGLDAICASYPGRLFPLHHLPVEKPRLAAEIARKCIAAGSNRFSAPASGHTELCYSDAALEPLWMALDERDSFIFLHPGACCDGRLHSFYLENLLGNPYETSVAAAHLVLGGVSARFPRIRFCLAHAGGATPMIAGRLQQGFDTKRPGIDTTRAEPRVALKGFMADCIAHDIKALELAAEVFGKEHILFGSDWPFPMGLLEPGKQLETLDPALRHLILRENAEALLLPVG